MSDSNYDVAILGAGNAAFCAALAAQESGAKVVMIEAAPLEEAGGNSRYTAGAIRFAHDGVEDLKTVVDLTDDEIDNADFGTYTSDQFYDDLFRLTQFRADPDKAEALVTKSLETVQWMKSRGVKFQPSYGRQAFKVDGKYRFWGGLCVETWGGGEGLIELETKSCGERGIEILYETRAMSLLYDEEKVNGVKVKHKGKVRDIRAKAVVLASGGFEANAEMRTRYLGPGWEMAKVRGTRHNQGEGIKMALDIGAMSYGNWSGCHAVAWDVNAPEFGDLTVGDNVQKHSYPLGVMINAEGKRFVDEGADFRNYTYAKYGREILNQPGMLCWQVFDQKVTSMLRDEYRIRRVTKVTGNTLEELVEKMEGVEPKQALKTLKEYNAAVDTDTPFNPAVLDGRGTPSLDIPKTNWANTLDEGPFEAYGLGCGITFTFGGLRVTEDAQVVDTDQRPIPGLYAAGELVGGIFYHNYPGGTGLMSGAVFGRAAGSAAARSLKEG